MIWYTKIPNRTETTSESVPYFMRTAAGVHACNTCTREYNFEGYFWSCVHCRMVMHVKCGKNSREPLCEGCLEWG